MPGPALTIRPAAPHERSGVLALARRLSDVGTPPGRDPERTREVDTAQIAATLDADDPARAVLVAVEDDRLVGFVHLLTLTDYYTQAPIGHVSDLVVAAEAEGRGMGRVLLDAAEEWARDRGYARMQLVVVMDNDRARGLYERHGYHAEWLKYVKPLAP